MSWVASVISTSLNDCFNFWPVWGTHTQKVFPCHDECKAGCSLPPPLIPPTPHPTPSSVAMPLALRFSCQAVHDVTVYWTPTYPLRYLKSQYIWKQKLDFFVGLCSHLIKFELCVWSEREGVCDVCERERGRGGTLLPHGVVSLFFFFWLAWKMWVHVMISVRPSDRQSGRMW